MVGRTLVQLGYNSHMTPEPENALDIKSNIVIPDSVFISPDTTKIDTYLGNKKALLEKIFTDSDHRLRILTRLYKLAERTPDKAPFGLVPGTSLALFPEKFTARVKAGSDLINLGRINYLVFSGSTDNQAPDSNQAQDAAKMAIDRFNVDPTRIILVGGTNTEQNFVEAGKILTGIATPPFDMLVTSENLHLIRAISVGRFTLRPSGITPWPYPADGHVMLDPNDPRVIRELIKAYAYIHTLYPHPNPNTLSYIRSEIDSTVQHYDFQLGFK